MSVSEVPPGLKRPGLERLGLASNQVAILACAAAALATAAVSLTTLNHVKDAVVAASLHGQAIGVGTLAGVVGPVDLGLVLVAGVTVLALAWLEWRDRSWSRLLATATDRQAFVLLTIVVAWLGHSYLSPGVLLGGDTGTHISRFLEVQRGLEHGELPFWTNYQYAGAPLLWFTGPLTYIVGGALAFVLQDAVAATKLLLFALHMLSGWLFFAMLRRFGIRTVAAMVAAAGFAGSFAHLHLFLFRGVIPQAFTIVFLILLFHAADGLLRGIGARWLNLLVFALATAGMIINHQPHAIFAAAYLALFGAAALLTRFWPARGIPLLIVAGGLGAVASVIAVIPVLFEADWVMIEPGDALFSVHLPTASRLLNLALWRNTRTTWGIDYWAYLGLGTIVFAAVGLAMRAPHRRLALPAGVCLAVCLVLFNPVVRDVIYLLFFAGLLAGIGLDWLMQRSWLGGRGLLLAVVVVVADLASTSVQPVARTDKGFMVEAGQMLERTSPNQRVMLLSVAPDGSIEADIGPDNGPMSYYSTVQRVAGNHNMAATRVHNFMVAVAKMAEADLQSAGLLSPETRTLLAVFNVGRIVCTSSVANGCPPSVRDAANDPVLGRYLPVAAVPAVFSQRLTRDAPPAVLEKPMLWPWDFLAGSPVRPTVDAIDAELRGFLAVEQLDLPHATAAAIAVRELPPVQQAAGGWHPTIQAYAVGLDKVTLQVDADAAGYVQMAHPWFQSTRVTVNGAGVRPLQGMIDLMVVPIQPGVSVIELQDGWTAIRRVSAVVSALGLVAILAAAAVLAWRDNAFWGLHRARLDPAPGEARGH